jgi:pilus assembly protein Flp/PilA
MRKQFVSIVKAFARDERGASLLEYTVLLGLIAAVSLATILSVGDWVSDRWVALFTKLTANTPAGS